LEKKNSWGPGERPAERQSVGENVVRKLDKPSSLVIAGIAAICLFLSNGCSGGNGANVITVSMSPAADSLILGQSVNLTATVSGAANLNVNWEKCMFTTTTTNTNGTPKTNAAQQCVPDPNHTPSDPNFSIFGTLTNQEATGTATFTAPNTLPDPTKYPGLQIQIIAQSAQNTAKTGTTTLTLVSGITAVLNPQTASVPVTEVQQFSVLLTNDLQNKGVTWSLTQNNPNTNSSGTFINFPQLPTCSPTCGKIAPPDPNNPNVALYTSPSTIPTAITPAQTNNTNCPQNLTVVATSVADPTEFTTGTITLVSGGPITFNGITPTIAPQGATLWDIYLNAPGISSSSVITLTDSTGQAVSKDSSSGQIKVLFPLPPPPPTTTTTTSACTTTNPTSTGARLRLTETDLAAGGPITVAVSDPTQTVTQSTAGTFTYNVIPVRPTSIGSVPDDVVQNASTPSQTTPVTIDGGYFGPSGNLATIFFQGNGISQNPNHPSSSRQLNSFITTSQINTGSPGLYTLSVASRETPLPNPNNSSVTNIAVFPDYSANPPTVTASAGAIPAGTNPSAIDIDSTLGVVVVAETGSNAVQFFTIGQGTLTPIDSTGAACTTGCPVAVGKIPTNLSVNRVNHTVAVVNYGDQTITVLPIPVPGATTQNPAPGTPFTVDISGALQGSISPAPLPYSIGVDPDSNLALVAYSSTSALTTANLGIVVNLNPNVSSSPYGCILGQSISSSSNQFGQCLYAQVSLNNGAYPQIAMAPHGHLALVTPGGSGVVQGVDVTRKSTANIIKSATLNAGLVTVTIDTTLCPNAPGTAPTPSSSTVTCPLLLVPGNAGSVLITNMTPGNSANKALFNGVFPVAVLSNNSFSYSVLNITAVDTATGECNSSNICAEVFYGSPDQTFPMTPTAQGVAINSVTHTAAVADANAIGTNGSQIWLLNSLDQSVTSFGFSATCTAFTVPCASAAEFLATTGVAWQPYTNELVSYNPSLNQVSISDPVSRLRYGFACEVNNASKTGAGTSCITNPNTAPTTVCPSLNACQQMFLNQITLQGTGTASLTVQNNTTGTLKLFGGLAVDPVSNQAFVVMSGSGNIDVVNLNSPTPVKPLHVSDVIVPSPTPGPGVIGGVPHALVPQATLTCRTPVAPATSCDLPGVQIFGTGFDSTTQVRLDGTSIPLTNVQVNSARQLTATIPASFLGFPHHYALDLINGSGVQSNAVDFIVVQAVDLSQACTNPSNATTMPTSVAIADQFSNGPFSPLALISVTGCNSVVALDINPTVNGQPNPHLGQMYGPPVAVGTSPQGIAISQPLGLAVVTNNGSNTASILNLAPLAPCAPVAPMPASNCSPVEIIPDVSVGTNPTGVSINDATGIALVANTGSNTVSSLNLATLFANGSTAAATSLTPITIGGVQQPLAVAIDPDRGPNNQGIAVVTSVALSAGSAPTGSLAVVDIGTTTPVLSTTISSGFVSGTPTGVVFDPVVATGTANPGVFFANSSGTNTITEFNPDSGGGSSVNVGINPTSLAVNPQTGAILTSNSASNTISIVDTLSNPFRTLQTLGFPGSPTFGVAIDQFTNLAVIVDQANNRVFLFPMPN
jgi:DNA-binding beta-propeller fold protein YncE